MKIVRMGCWFRVNDYEWIHFHGHFLNGNKLSIKDSFSVGNLLYNGKVDDNMNKELLNEIFTVHAKSEGEEDG